MSVHNITLSGTPLGVVAGIGLFLILPGQAKADRDGASYGHAEITLGFPHGQVTVGKTWDDHPRDDAYDDDEDGDGQVIIERRIHRHRHKKVVIIERYGEPVRCDREDVVRRVYVQPPCPRPEVVVYRRPERVIYAPSRYCAPAHNAVIVPPGRGYSGGHEGRGSGHVESRGSGPRDLFPEDRGRPMRTRGVQHQVAQAGSGSH